MTKTTNRRQPPTIMPVFTSGGQKVKNAYYISMQTNLLFTRNSDYFPSHILIISCHSLQYNKQKEKDI